MAVGLDRFEEMRRRLRELETRTLAQGDPNLAAHYQEMGTLEKRLRTYMSYLGVKSRLEEAEAVLADRAQDKDFRELAREEAEELRESEAELRRRLLIELVSEEGGDRRSAIFEIRAGTGGEEAALFAGDLFRMYRYYAEAKRWKLEALDISPSDMGGFKEIIFRLEGEGVFSRLRFEGGAHRVQRVPKTEAQGRIHTSVATVAIMAEPEQVELNVPDSDLEIKVTRSGGPGGQSVNTTDSCVQILHKPTGIVVKCMVEKSQHRNRLLAMKILRAKLLEAEEERAASERSENRRNQIGSGDRSDRIRTYNYPQNRVTDHRLVGDKNFSLEKVIEGDLDAIIDRLVEQLAGISPAE